MHFQVFSYMMRTIIGYVIGMVLLLGACRGGHSSTDTWQDGDTLRFQYARLLTVVKHPEFTIASIRNPWDTVHTLHTYILVPRDAVLPQSLPQGTVVRTPLQHSVLYSAVHCGLLQELGAFSAIAGVCDLKYIDLESIQQAVVRGQIADCGDAMQPNVEQIIDLHPDAILLSPFENSGGYGRVEKLDIPLIECADYMETSALGRAEWARFYGLLFGTESVADSLFSGVEARYLDLKQKARQSSVSKSVISERKSGSAWYMPGGRSTVAGVFADACARYPFADTQQSGSVPLAFETVFDKGGDADIWLIKYNSPHDLTYVELETEFAGYKAFKAFQNRMVYGCNTARIPYYEETPFHPDRLLSDLIQIFHPDLSGFDGLRYYTKLP